MVLTTGKLVVNCVWSLPFSLSDSEEYSSWQVEEFTSENQNLPENESSPILNDMTAYANAMLEQEIYLSQLMDTIDQELSVLYTVYNFAPADSTMYAAPSLDQSALMYSESVPISYQLAGIEEYIPTTIYDMEIEEIETIAEWEFDLDVEEVEVEEEFMEN